MQVQPHTTAGRIVAMFGKAVARGADGKLRMVTVGDWVEQDDVIVTAQNGYVQLAFDDAASRSTALVTQRYDNPAPGLASANASAPLSESTGASMSAALRVDAVTEALTTAVTALADSTHTTRAVFTAKSNTDHLAPLANAARLTTAEDTPLHIALTGHDPDGALAQVWVLKVPTGGVLYKADGVPIADRTELTPAEAESLVFKPAPDFHGNPGPLQFMVVDASGKASAVATVGITVESVNDAPIPGTVPLGPDSVAIQDAGPNHITGTPDYRYATIADHAVAGRINATDVDLDPIRFSTAVDPLHGQVAVAADGSFVYTPGAAYTGADRFVVRVDDGHAGTATSTVFIDVGPAPVVGQGLFAWSLAEPAPLRTDFTVAPSEPDRALALDLNALLQGSSRLQPAHGVDLFPAESTALSLGLDLDANRSNIGLDPLREWHTPLSG